MSEADESLDESDRIDAKMMDLVRYVKRRLHRMDEEMMRHVGRLEQRVSALKHEVARLRELE